MPIASGWTTSSWWSVPKCCGDAPRVLELVERRLVEADREGLHARAGDLGHQPDDQARVDAAREERAERHVADQVRADGVGQHGARSSRTASASDPVKVSLAGICQYRSIAIRPSCHVSR